ncbi:MAG: methyltransferase domain-containing protein [Pseudomonadota bacterium]
MSEYAAEHVEEYDEATIRQLELIWGKGFMAPGGAGLVQQVLEGINVRGKRILDIGCGLGGGALAMARDLGARVVGIDLEAPLIANAQGLLQNTVYEGVTEFHHSKPGPLDFDDESFDVVYSVGAFTQTPDKSGLFSESFRVLRSDGHIVSYDWTKAPGPLSEEMQIWIALEGLTYEMVSIEEQCSLLSDAGFKGVNGRDDQGWYANQACLELEQLQGGLSAEMAEQFGEERAALFVEDWRAMVAVLARAELVPAFFSGRKP